MAAALVVVPTIMAEAALAVTRAAVLPVGRAAAVHRLPVAGIWTTKFRSSLVEISSRKLLKSFQKGSDFRAPDGCLLLLILV